VASQHWSWSSTPWKWILGESGRLHGGGKWSLSKEPYLSCLQTTATEIIVTTATEIIEIEFLMKTESKYTVS